MKKMKTVFVIDHSTRHATDDIHPESQWVIDGEGWATVKHDGTSCMIEGGVLHRRFDAKKGKTPPKDWLPCEVMPDPVTGHWPGWVKVDPTDQACKWHLEAFTEGLEDGTFELVGPKVQGNKHGLARHELWRHGREIVEVERTREAIVEWLMDHEAEGLVFHHPDGRMAKVRRKDFGIKW